MTTFWDNCLEYFQTVLTAQQYKTWILPLEGSINDNNIVIQAPNRFLLVWARDSYSKDFKRIAKDTSGHSLPIEFSLKYSEHVG